MMRVNTYFKENKWCNRSNEKHIFTCLIILCWRIHAFFMLKNSCVFCVGESMRVLCWGIHVSFKCCVKTSLAVSWSLFYFFCFKQLLRMPLQRCKPQEIFKGTSFYKLALIVTSRKVCSVVLKTGILYQMDNTFRYIVFYMSVPKFIVFKNVYLDRINCYFCLSRGRGKSKRKKETQ